VCSRLHTGVYSIQANQMQLFVSQPGNGHSLL
jgi:hypothetical protein